MSRNTFAIIAILIIIDALVLTTTFIGFSNEIVPLNIVGTVIVLLFVINAFISAWLLDLLKPIFESLGNMFGGLGGLLGR
jgi:CBS domain containing-hemolysin-like protein